MAFGSTGARDVRVDRMGFLGALGGEAKTYWGYQFDQVE